MDFPTSLLTFAIAVAGLTLIPGATTMLVIRRAMLGGSSASLFTIIGGSAGVFVHAIVAALGLSALFQYNALARDIVRWLGAAYLIWLGTTSLWRAWRGNAGGRTAWVTDPNSAPTRTTREAATRTAACAEGFVTILLSPETALFYLSALSQFIGPNEWMLGKAILLAAIHAGIRLSWYSLVAVFVSRMYAILVRPLVQRSLEGATGALLILFAVRAATARR